VRPRTTENSKYVGALGVLSKLEPPDAVEALANVRLDGLQKEGRHA
jgi:hypothetical protein